MMWDRHVYMCAINNTCSTACWPTVKKCSDGTTGVDGHGEVCCPIGCSQCTGKGCGSAGAAFGLGADDCCGSNIKDSGVYCDDTNEAPCIIGSAPGKPLKPRCFICRPSLPA